MKSKLKIEEFANSFMARQEWLSKPIQELLDELEGQLHELITLNSKNHDQPVLEEARRSLADILHLRRTIVDLEKHHSGRAGEHNIIPRLMFELGMSIEKLRIKPLVLQTINQRQGLRAGQEERQSDSRELAEMIARIYDEHVLIHPRDKYPLVIESIIRKIKDQQERVISQNTVRARLRESGRTADAHKEKISASTSK